MFEKKSLLVFSRRWGTAPCTLSDTPKSELSYSTITCNGLNYVYDRFDHRKMTYKQYLNDRCRISTVFKIILKAFSNLKSESNRGLWSNCRTAYRRRWHARDIYTSGLQLYQFLVWVISTLLGLFKNVEECVGYSKSNSYLENPARVRQPFWRVRAS